MNDDLTYVIVFLELDCSTTISMCQLMCNLSNSRDAIIFGISILKVYSRSRVLWLIVAIDLESVSSSSLSAEVWGSERQKMEVFLKGLGPTASQALCLDNHFQCHPRPTGENIIKRGMNTIGLCPLCKKSLWELSASPLE